MAEVWFLEDALLEADERPTYAVDRDSNEPMAVGGWTCSDVELFDTWEHG